VKRYFYFKRHKNKLGGSADPLKEFVNLLYEKRKKRKRERDLCPLSSQDVIKR